MSWKCACTMWRMCQTPGVAHLHHQVHEPPTARWLPSGHLLSVTALLRPLRAGSSPSAGTGGRGPGPQGLITCPTAGWTPRQGPSPVSPSSPRPPARLAAAVSRGESRWFGKQFSCFHSSCFSFFPKKLKKPSVCRSADPAGGLNGAERGVRQEPWPGGGQAPGGAFQAILGRK